MIYIIFLLFSLLNFSNSSELELRNNLFKNYNKNLRPVKYYNNSIDLNVSIDIRNLEYFNQVAETISINIWLLMTWKDEYLKWNINKYNINSLNFNSNNIWLPDLVLYNSAKKEEMYNVLDQMTVSNEGVVTLIRPSTFTFTCPLQLQEFPYDTQKCYMEFGSWQFNKQYLNIKYNNNIPSTYNNFTKNNEWDLIKLEHIDNEFEYLCCPNEIWTVLKYNVYLSRYSQSYSLFITMTILLTISASVISLFKFKIYYRIYVLVFIPLTIIWLLQSIIKRIPVIGYFTIMDKLLLTSFIVCEFYTVESGILYNIYTNSNYIKKFIKNNIVNIDYSKLYPNHNIIKGFDYNINKYKDTYLYNLIIQIDNILRILIFSIYLLFIIIIFR
jgi:hypothetical protein